MAAGAAPFAAWVNYAEAAGTRQEKLEMLLRTLYLLLGDLLVLQQGGERIRNGDARERLGELAGRVSFAWLRKAVAKVDELAELARRNIQKNLALDALAVELRGAAGEGR